MVPSRVRYRLLKKIMHVILLIAVLQAATLHLSLAYNDLPERPQPGLPERPVVPQPPNPAKETEVFDARIILHTNRWDKSLWAVIQWQGTDGTWHDVSGWRGQFNQYGQVRWRVEAKDFNTGPFRWVIYNENYLNNLWMSIPFDLPNQGEVLEFRAAL